MSPKLPCGHTIKQHKDRTVQCTNPYLNEDEDGEPVSWYFTS
jgi:hypothetical protein